MRQPRGLKDSEYEDDLALLSRWLQKMRLKMGDLKVAGNKLGLKINAKKTKLTELMFVQEGKWESVRR